VLVLLRQRERTGVGGHVDCSAIEAVTATLGMELLAFQAGLPQPERRGNMVAGWYVNDVFPCYGDDEWLAVSLADDGEWRRFCAAIGLDPAVVPADTDSVQGVTRLWERISQRTRSLDAARLEGQLTGAGIAAARSMSLRASMTEPRLGTRDVLQTVEPKRGAPQQIITLPWLFNGHAYPVPAPAPLLGEHSQAILGEWLGRGEAEAIPHLLHPGSRRS
jgi:benzylsuccinate CoA-transferase BbsF subunit